MKHFELSFFLTLLISMVGQQTFAYNIATANSDGVTICYNWANNNTELSVTYRPNSGYWDKYAGSIVIPETVTYGGKTYNVTSIGNYAFMNCSDLTSITIPNSVTSIEDYAFNGCTGLTKVIIKDIDAWCKISFNDTYSNPLLYAHHLYSDENTEITSVVFPDGMTSIGGYVFSGCYSLTSVTIPNSVTSIGARAFYNCSSLSSITIPNSVTSIGSSSFYGLTALKSIVIPASVESIDQYAFYGCNKLLDVVTLITSPVSIADDAFSDKTYADGLLYVPKGTKSKYKVRRGWRNFVYMEEGVPAGIDNIANEGAKEAARYTLGGKRVATPQPGLNIVRMTDGSTRKVVVK